MIRKAGSPIPRRTLGINASTAALVKCLAPLAGRPCGSSPAEAFQPLCATASAAPAPFNISRLLIPAIAHVPRHGGPIKRTTRAPLYHVTYGESDSYLRTPAAPRRRGHRNQGRDPHASQRPRGTRHHALHRGLAPGD